MNDIKYGAIIAILGFGFLVLMGLLAS